MYNWILGESPFSYNKNIKKVVITEGVTNVGESAFYYCTELTEVTISSSVTKLSGAFYQCSGLKKITVPKTVTEISNGEFLGCHAELTIYCKIFIGGIYE